MTRPHVRDEPMSADEKLEPVAWAKPRDEPWVMGERLIWADKRTEDWMTTFFTIPLYAASALEASEAKIAALTAENATLREVLETIRTHISVSGTSSLDMREIARAALRQEGKP